MFSGMAEGWALLTWQTLGWASIGVLIASAVAVMPGLGGAFVLAILIPVAFSLEPMAGIAILTAAIVVTSTANTITGVLFGIPGSASGVATIFDGYPMAQRGEGGRAVSAGLVASLVGGLIGAVALGALLPIARPMVLAFGPPEFFSLVLVAVLVIAQIQEGETLRSLISGALGFMVSFVGVHNATAAFRFTFGSGYLSEGFPLIAVVIGLFAIAEMIDLGRRRTSIASGPSLDNMGLGWSQTVQGAKDVFIHWRETLSSSIIGVVVGIIPGMGSGAAQFLAYGHAARVSPNREQFGKGAVEGVIASDAATNSKEGGSLVPTLVFGVPGSANMAILLAAYIGIGITPGPSMVTTQLPLTWMIIWLIVLSNVLATALSLFASIPLAKLTLIKGERLVPAIILICLWGGFTASFSGGDLFVVIAFGFFGYVLKKFGYSRSTFVIGLVLAPLVESNYVLAMRLWGPAFLLRPWTMVILAIPVLLPLGKAYLNRRSSRRADIQEPRVEI